ncbi:MAG: hypothetical protein ACAH12_01590 [Methylophilaceae bacterium]|uniref:hypothetical protein n=1 Tax=Methylovorus sp. MM2 TaxID=1848038 RepID=UPI0007DF5742|nr:hypothetical protein [Methylovorus sp. MM2]OAM51580.1 hypothetical protein A7981_08865 [Methylovorus sp. MM2]
MSEQVNPCYSVKQDFKGDSFWVYYSSNGAEVARSSRSYASQSDCLITIDQLQKSAKSPIVFAKEK